MKKEKFYNTMEQTFGEDKNKRIIQMNAEFVEACRRMLKVIDKEIERIKEEK